MKQILIIAFVVAACGCAPPHQEEATPERNGLVEQLVSNTHSIVVVGEGEPRLITNRTGQVLIGYPMQPIGAVTSKHNVSELADALTETGTHGSAGNCFCGVLPYQIFLNAQGAPLVGVHVNAHHQNVILSTNLGLFGGQLYATSPTGEWYGVESPLPSGYNPTYGHLALQVVKRIWPEECLRRELPGCEDLIKARKEAEAKKAAKKRIESLLRLSDELEGSTTTKSTLSPETAPSAAPSER